jgi:hypothetical protein
MTGIASALSSVMKERAVPLHTLNRLNPVFSSPALTQLNSDRIITAPEPMMLVRKFLKLWFLPQPLQIPFRAAMMFLQ